MPSEFLVRPEKPATRVSPKWGALEPQQCQRNLHKRLSASDSLPSGIANCTKFDLFKLHGFSARDSQIPN
jgi:hypothetical protein